MFEVVCGSSIKAAGGAAGVLRASPDHGGAHKILQAAEVAQEARTKYKQGLPPKMPPKVPPKISYLELALEYKIC